VPRFQRTQVVPRPRSEVFAFFADAANLEALTPGFLSFHILTPLPIEMKAGALIEYELALYRIPIRWKTLIETFEPETHFVDVQLRGPYRTWRHLHTFRDHPQGTEIVDEVEYSLPLRPFSGIALPLVKRQLRAIFDFRAQAVTERFGAA